MKTLISQNVKRSGASLSKQTLRLTNMDEPKKIDKDAINIENREWLDSFDYIYNSQGPERVKEVLRMLQSRASEYGVHFKYPVNTPYINTIPAEKQPRFPGIREI